MICREYVWQMKIKVLWIVVIIETLVIAGALLGSYILKGAGFRDGLFKDGSCLRDDTIGVVYKTIGSIKGRTTLEIIKSERSPDDDQFKVGHEDFVYANENPKK